MRKQLRNLPGARQIAKPEQAASGVEQPEPHKLINGAAEEVAQGGDLIGRVGPVQAVRDRLPGPFEKATFAYHRNAVAARSAQLVGRPAIIQQRPTEFANNKHIGLSRDRLAGRSAM